MKTRELVKEVLEREGVSPYKLAQEMGVKDPTVYRWKNGQREASGQHMQELLRRAGRLAASVVLTFGVLGATPENEAKASQNQSVTEQSVLLIIRTK